MKTKAYERLRRCALCAALLTPAFGQTGLEPELKKFTDVFARVEANAAEPVDSRQAIFGGAIPGMLRRLDPHSVFLDPDQYEQLKQMEKSERKGFGSVVSVLPGRVIILQTVAGTPSAKAGLSPGDEILAINNIPLNRLEFDQLIQLLTEARQHQVKLDVRRPGNARMLQFVLTPELVDSPSVDRAFMLRPSVAYVRVASFDPKTGEQLKAAIDKLGGTSLKGLVLDLRNNPGGVVEAALKTSALFLKPGQKILSVKGRAVQGEEIDVPKDAKPYEFPVAILINEKTASAAEIVTGALQDHDRAAVVGEPSYGKGLVQSVYNLSGNSAVALTTAFYYTPSGRSIQKPLEGVQLGIAIGKAKPEFKTDSGRLVTGGGGIQPDEIAGPEPVTRLRMVLDASGAMTTFATEYTQKNKVAPDFTATGAILDDLKVWLSERNIQPPVNDWLRDKSWIASRLTQEILTLAFGVEKGDEVEAQRDPVVQAALARISR
jgi:carboxyl-terminal processing protease